ncbi:MAG: TlpA disulfide reductase family protein [Actinomycetota bacterium]|jgi:cytochrome c biogenesis protein CcmG, thiol:disulfide interchange protein DsbE
MPRRAEIPDLLEPEPPAPRRRRWGWWLLAGVILVGAAVGVAISTDDSLGKVPGTIKLTGEARKFTLEDVRVGRPPVSLEALRGKPVVLNFFASWCGPCIREMPALQAMSERYRGRVHFVGVTFNDRREAAKGVLDRTRVSYPAAFDPSSDLAVDYAVRVMPTTFFIDADGKLVERKDGEISEVQLGKVIERLFGAS